ncbi:hypothetical protein IIA15_04375, partial [candidate division TA06 bacterium]|nr:hypothetical protein [candidate division TA06 bacterium]
MFRWFRLCGWAIFFVFFTHTIVGAVPPKVDVRPVGRDGQTHSSPILPLPHPLPESGQRAGRSAPTNLSLLHSDERGVTFRYTPPEPSFQIKRMEEGTFSDLSFPGTTYPSPKAGQPMLPFLLVHLGLPLEGEVRVEIENLRSSPHSHQYPITPFPMPDGAYEGDKEVYGRDGLYPGKWVEREGISYIRNQRVLSLRVYPVQFNATRKTLQILEEIQIRVEFLSGDGVGAGLKPALTDPFERVYEKVLINYEEAKGWRRRAGRSSPSILSSRPWLKISTNEAGIYRLTYKELIRTGAPVNFIDPRTFQMFNGGSDTLPQALATPRPDSVEVSLYIRGEEDSTFNPGDEIFFYGMPLTGWRMEGDTLRFHRNPYTDVNVYWLTWDGGMGKRMVSLDGSLSEPNPIRPDRYEEVLHLEEEVANPQKSGLAWIWQILNRSASQSIVSYSFPFALSDLASSVGEIRLNLYGRSTTLHNVRVRLNGNQVADTSWVSPNNETIQNIPVVLSPLVSQFREGGNTIQIEEYRTDTVGSEVYFDFAEAVVERRFVAKREVLDFTSPVGVLGRTEFALSGFSQLPMILDVSDPFRPLRVENASFQSDTVRFQDDLSTRKRYIVASTFQKPIRMVRDSPTDLKTGGAHYIALCHDDFYDAVLPLIQWREEHLAADISNPIVERVKVSDVYDNFSWGVVDPTAIRDFLKFTHDTLTSWSPKPVYCLFVGAGSYDYKNNMRLFPHKNFIPPHQKGGRVVTNSPFPQDLNPGFDQWFVVFDTAASAKPQIHLGRITVTSPQETRTVVEKIIDYEKKKAYGPWRNRVLLAADDVYSTAS